MIHPVSHIRHKVLRYHDEFMDEMRETRIAGREAWQWIRTHNWKATAKFVFQRKYWGWWVLLFFIVALSTVLSSFHHQIVIAIDPHKYRLAHAQWLWVLILVLLVVISFPPLFGHELVLLVVGLIYGLWVGFAIACAGTFLGEIACFYVFRYLLTERAKKIEAKHLAYTCLARLMREGGVKMSILVRFSAIPGHVTTAVQSTIGMSIWVYSIAAAVSLPKQFALVYLGVVFGQTTTGPLAQWEAQNPGVPRSVYYTINDSSSKRTRVSLIVFAATSVATMIAAWVVWMRIRRIRPFVIADMEKLKRQESQDEEETYQSGTGPTLRRASALAGIGHDPDPIRNPVTTEFRRGPIGGTHLRPTLLNLGSNGSDIALLEPRSMVGGRSRSGTLSTMGAGGRSRSGTLMTTVSTLEGGRDRSNTFSTLLSTPSLPHLPLSEAEADDYVSSTQGMDRERRMSH